MLTICKRVLHNKGMAKTLKLTGVETDICKLLKDYSAQYNAHRSTLEPLTLRITGGWVRDKLLGFASHDLDIAVNIMSGEQFATGLSQYLTQHHDDFGIVPHSIHKIDKNPEKSKHLETATTKLFGIEVDFVNLRSEEYTEDSRIPIVEFGTPEQDALRRDATLNALFYNIQTETIEDFTGRGLRDLESGTLRTPLPPRQTFLDDPLRVLRLIRFASRLNFTIEERTFAEMADDEINQAFLAKISRERVGTEMQKILHGPDPLLGLELIHKACLENVIFFWHSDNAIIEHNRKESNMKLIDAAYQKLRAHMRVVLEKLPDLLTRCPDLKLKWEQDLEFRQTFILGVVLAPFKDIEIVWNPKKTHNKLGPIADYIVKEGLKFGKGDAELVSKCVQSQLTWENLLNKYKALSRSEIGLFLRSFEGNWEAAFFVNLALSFCLQESTLQRYQQLVEHIRYLQLQDSFQLKPLIDGKSLSKALGCKPGPWMKTVMSEMIVWQLDNPHGTEVDLLEYIKESVSLNQ
ncbi:LAMI_0H14928g1_1 [Lachancea mirantina]|uniref:CCA tRNA nucleotidyltransferase, mitochondrial n=1 Tax=Lachancea mirantina TaxID=1230905 RepID=A0A1G4KIA0_9SACH|nr:LAMI_0H14928g1_1 [Lachancea mirantina]